MLIELHYIKNYAVNNLNRDDMGAPKSCTFGGAKRTRISSQCLKRSWRQSDVFAEAVGEDNLGIRTRKMPELVKDKLIEKKVEPQVAEKIRDILSGIGNKKGTKNDDGTKTAQIVFYSREDIETLADAAEKCLKEQNGKPDKIKIDDIKAKIKDDKRPITIDIALFGRMVTSDIFRDVEAATEVAHAISTHKVSVEEDFFVAMDDLVSGASSSDSGAAILDETEYSSSCFYLYASIDTDILAANLKGAPDSDILVKKAVEGLLKAIAFTDPNGKQHGMSAHALPALAICECKKIKNNTSYANAFAKPVYTSANADIVAKSITELLNEQKYIREDFGIKPEASLVFCSSRYKDDVNVPDFDTLCRDYNDFVEKTVNLI